MLAAVLRDVPEALVWEHAPFTTTHCHKPDHEPTTSEVSSLVLH